jgi:tRNA dimethylallyltransferase
MSSLNEKDLLDTSLPVLEHFLEQFPGGIIILWWATATGKTGLSLKVAEQFSKNIEIISADSRQVYRGMDIGTDKVSREDQARVPHRWIDMVDPDGEFTAGQWKTYAEQKIAEIQSRGNIPIVVGGTGLYIDMLYRNFSIPELAPQRERRNEMMNKENETPGFLYAELQRIDPEEAHKHHANSTRYLLRALEICHFTWKTKTELSWEQPVRRPILMLWLRREKEETNALIDQRIDELFERGLVDEVCGLLDAWYTADLQSMNTIGYKEIVGYLQGEYDLASAKELLKQNTHRLAKRQRTWFRKYLLDAKHQPKDGVVYKTLFL